MAVLPVVYVRGVLRGPASTSASPRHGRLSRRRLGIVLASATALAFVVACHVGPRLGEPCRASGRTACASRTEALVCEGGQWRAVPCRGDRGCAPRGREEACDDTRSAEGDPCAMAPGPDYACSLDHASALVCQGSHFTVWRRCRGPNGCRVESDGRVDCDTTLGAPSDPCGKRGSYACSADQQTMLECDGRVLVPASSCRGPGGCRFDRETRQVNCADSIAMEGDPCEDTGRVSCTPGGERELVCREAIFTEKRECRRTACRVEGTELFCD